MDTILLFPGQGSQRPGMGKDLAEAYPAAREVFAAADEALGASLSRLCFDGPEDELTLTHHAQPALLAHGAAAWAAVRDALAPHVRAAGGHSLGEFTAHHAAGTLPLADAARLVRRRGELMYRSGIDRPGAMAAILGLPAEAVEALCREASTRGVVVPANYNTPEQLVISGEVAAVERAMVLARERGAKRAIRLNVSGAFHSPLMAVAMPGLAAALDEARFAPARFAVYSNVSTEPAGPPADARRLLLEQLTSPVHWTEQVRHMAAAHPGALFVELGPGNVLTNLVRRIVPEAQTATCGTARDVDTLLQRVA